MQIDITVLRGRDDESIAIIVIFFFVWIIIALLFTLVIVNVFHDLDRVNQRFVSYDEHFEYELVLRRLVVEINILDVPDLHLARGVSSDQGLVTFGYSAGR